LKKKWSSRKKLFAFTGALFVVVIVIGWMITAYLRDQAFRGIASESEADTMMLAIYLSSEFSKIEGSVKSLSGSPAIAPVLLSPVSKNLKNANLALDRYNSAMGASVSYLMDARGIVIASTNRLDPDSFVGRSYSFRPYFTKAIKGMPCRYFALGITSGTRGFYASHPVKSPAGKVIGVVVMKKDLDETALLMRKFHNCFLISPEGIVFLSSRPELLYRSLWPVREDVRKALIASEQFGIRPFQALHSKELVNGEIVDFLDQNYLVNRKTIDREGWSVVFLASTGPIQIYKTIGIMITLSLCLLISIFTVVNYLTQKSRQVIKERERRYRTLFNGANDAILIIKDGRYVDCNDLTLKMFGCTREQIIGKYPDEFSPSLQPDGRSSLEEAREKIRLAMTGEPQFFEWKHRRQDGSLFDAEVSLNSIPVNGDILIQAFVRDITERKRLENEIKALSITDPLTGLYNRRGFLTLSEQQMKIADRKKQGLLLLFADLDEMKWINDNLGHEKGDDALIETASVLRQVFRQSDIIARIGGDEFAILAMGDKTLEGVLIDRLQELIKERNSLNGRVYRLSLSVGAAWSDPQNPQTIDSLMSRADQAMYDEKRKKKG